MATRNGLLTAWGLITTTAGRSPPWSDVPGPGGEPSDLEAAITAWLLVLGDVPDDRLVRVTAAWLRTPDSKFPGWPTPGALLEALGEPEAIDDADDAWAEALALLAWRGRERCPTTPAELEDLRGRLRAAYALAREQGDADRMDRAQRIGARLPREDAERTEALFAGVRACGGWRALGMADEDAMTAHRASFRGAYRGQRQRRRLTETERRVVALLDGSSVRTLTDNREQQR